MDAFFNPLGAMVPQIQRPSACLRCCIAVLQIVDSPICRFPVIAELLSPNLEGIL